MRAVLDQQFRDAVRTYFNEELMEGTLWLGQGEATPPRLNMECFQAESFLPTAKLMDGGSEAIIMKAVQALFQRCMAGRPKAKVFRFTRPVFRTTPRMEIGGFNGAGWPIGVWCDMGWTEHVSTNQLLRGRTARSWS